MDVQELMMELDKAKGYWILVEGKNDKASLEELGFENVFSIDKMALYRVVEEIVKRTKDVVILTDLDTEGKKLYGYLNSELSQRGVRVHNRLRTFLFRHTKLRQIEGMVNYTRRQ